MRKSGVLLVALAVVTIVAGAHARPSVSPTAARDARFLARELQAFHPNLFRNVTRTRFQAEVDSLVRRAPGLDENEFLVGLMRIAALPGARNGHTGIFPLDPGHGRQAHGFPIRLYHFADGIFVVDEAGDLGLVGSRLVAVADVPVERVLRLVRPLVPHDNAQGIRGYAPHYLLTAEVLVGLGVAERVGPLELTFERAGGAREDVTLTPITTSEYLQAFSDPLHGHYPSIPPSRARPLYLANMGRELWLRKLDGGRAVYVGYNTATVSTDAVASRLLRLARDPRVRRVVVDVRLNGGGNNALYVPLLSALQRPQVNKRGKLFLLIGRGTFSAAGNFAADVDRSTRATLVGEPTGGGVNQYGDSETFNLPATGWHVYCATQYVRRGKESDKRLAIAPDIAVEPTSAHFFSGRDPVLERALGS
jgi:hypothetical protein